MAIYSTSFRWYNKANLHLNLSTLTSDTIKVALLTSSYTPNASTHEYYDVHITNEVANAYGYTTGGITLATKTFVESGTPGQYIFSSANPVWTASGGSIVARYWILYNATPSSNKPLLAYGHCNYNSGTPIDISADDTYPYTIVLSANGWFTTAPTNNP